MGRRGHRDILPLGARAKCGIASLAPLIGALLWARAARSKVSHRRPPFTAALCPTSRMRISAPWTGASAELRKGCEAIAKSGWSRLAVR